MKQSEFLKRQQFHMDRNIRNEEDINLVNDNIISFPTSQLLIRQFQKRNDMIFELTDRLRVVNNRLDKERERLMSEIESLQARIEELEKENANLKSKLERYENTDFVKLVFDTNAYINDMKQKQDKIESDLADYQARLAEFKNMMNNK